MGPYVAIDTIGKKAFRSDQHRAYLVVALANTGHADRILLSNDVSRDTYLFRATGGYSHLFDSFLRLLQVAGLKDGDLELILHDNPLRFLDPSARRYSSVASATGSSAVSVAWPARAIHSSRPFRRITTRITTPTASMHSTAGAASQTG